MSSPNPTKSNGGSPVSDTVLSAVDSKAASPSPSSSPPKTTSLSSGPNHKLQVPSAIWDWDQTALDQWMKSVPAFRDVVSSEDPNKKEVGTSNQILWKNLMTALDKLSIQERKQQPQDMEDDEEDEEDPRGPPNKKKKASDRRKAPKKMKKPKVLYDILDPMAVFVHTIRANEEEDIELGIDAYQEAAMEIKTTMGGKLTQSTLSGLINGLAGVEGGVVTNKQCQLKEGMNKETPIPTADNMLLGKIQRLAASLHQAIQARVEADVLVTTPIRIQELLASDLQPHEFKAIRKRIFDTVILGKGLNQGNPEEEEAPTAASLGMHDIEKFKKCKSCGNNDQSLFVLDKKNGDVICSSCGTVASESLMHEGSAYRKFEGEADRNHHGDAANPLYSNSHNMSTTLAGVQMTTGAGGPGYGTQKKGMETILRNAHAFTELNISQFGKTDRRTRTGYKDKQKREAFIQMTHCGDALNLHEAVVQRAKEIFAGFRDDRELVQQFKGVIAACLCEAFDQLSNDGKAILKQKIEEAPQETFLNARANRRNGLHHANLAGKGGLLLDYSAMKKEEQETLSSLVAMKPAATWDLDDCRSWLMEASRSIAQQWIQDRKNGNNNIPNGTQDELEGKLVEHAITLNDSLEAELKQQQGNQNGSGGHGRGRVVTPRVTDMSKLGIKWQHAHERGSGGKGGVGGSGTDAAAGRKGGRTAGQSLILKTAKKLGVILNDPFAGQAIHKELRSVINKQEAHKRKLQLEETTRQRLTQMKRKPWLQARVLS